MCPATRSASEESNAQGENELLEKRDFYVYDLLSAGYASWVRMRYALEIVSQTSPAGLGRHPS